MIALPGGVTWRPRRAGRRRTAAPGAAAVMAHATIARAPAWRGLAGLLLWVCPACALAATSTASFQVTISVLAICQIETTNLAFPSYANTADPGTASVTITCTNNTPYNVGLDAGGGAAASVLTRSLTGPGPVQIGYGLFSDAAHSLNWGTTVGTDTVTGTGTGYAQVLIVYGQVLAGQINASPGLFSDTVIATVTY
jgi:spore coat protein U-like protein